MHIILIGPQGSGKGVQAELLGERLGLVKLSTGDLFRAEIRAETPLGLEIKALYESGGLIDDRTTMDLVSKRLDQIKQAGRAGAIFDGFPRNAEQARLLDELMAERAERINAVVEFNVPREILMHRLSGRIVCPNCGATYQEQMHPPRVKGICDNCGEKLVVRSDDTADGIATRLDKYATSTAPLIDFYRNRGLLVTVNGNQAKESVASDILEAINPAQEG